MVINILTRQTHITTKVGETESMTHFLSRAFCDAKKIIFEAMALVFKCQLLSAQIVAKSFAHIPPSIIALLCEGLVHFSIFFNLLSLSDRKKSLS
jgi:hypothetical protein